MEETFILGSGFSKAIHDRMPTLRELSRSVRERFGGGWDPRWGKDLERNVELLLTYLGSNHPWENPSERHFHRGAFFQVRDLVVDLIEEAQSYVVKSMSEPPAWLWDLIDYWHETRPRVITFNYDVLVELAYSKLRDKPGLRSPFWLYPAAITPAALRMAGAYGQPGREETFTLLKPHGSLSWYFSGPEAPPGDVVYWDGQYGWRPPKPPSERLLGDKQRLVVPPLLEKSPYYANDLLRRQWELTREAIADADRVTCIGYSLPETDLTVRYLLSTAFPHVENVEIVDIDNQRKVERHYRDLLPGSNVVARSTGSTAVADYVRSLI